MIPQFLLESPIPMLLPLLAMFCMTVLNTAALQIGRIKTKNILSRPGFFFITVLKKIFPRQEWDALQSATNVSKNIYQVFYTLSSFFYLGASIPWFHELSSKSSPGHDWLPLTLSAALLLGISLFCDLIARILASLWPESSLKRLSLFTSFFLLVVFPLVYLLLKITRRFAHKGPMHNNAVETIASRTQIRELIRESELQHHFDPFDQKLISSFVNFRERVAKEIMVPRIDIFSLPAENTIREAGRLLADEEYSRIPVYRDSLDQVIGVVLYKDLLKVYAGLAGGAITLDSPLESMAKPVIYSPENKKIAHLLQEFRTKQLHMAIIVDEYGGTEGIVTIEDILEELVGEIEDEYDIEENQPFQALPDGSWVVDAKMNILDIEEQLGIQVPSNPEYETIGGYVFHCAGTIPAKGWRLMHDKFDLEVLNSSERSVKKIRIIPHSHPVDYTSHGPDQPFG
jgi:putative hemolysin